MPGRTRYQRFDGSHADNQSGALRWSVAGIAALALLLQSLSAPAAPQTTHKWIGTWAQSMTSNYEQVKGADGSPKKDAYDHPIEQAPSVHDMTIRQTVLSSIGGNRVRVRLSNYFGQRPLMVNAGRVALQAMHHDDLAAIKAPSDHRLTFNGGNNSVKIAPGHEVVSDPVTMHVPALSNLTVSLYFAHAATLADMHPMEHAKTTYAATGNAAKATSLSTSATSTALGKHWQKHIYILNGVEVSAPKSTRGIVAFGDSITDGAYATAQSKPWPQALARVADGTPGRTSAAVVNAGISADELTTDQIGAPGAGISGLKRFERDVIEQPGVTDVIVLFGANDINRGIDPAGDLNGASAGDIIASYRMLIDVAHQHHLRIYAGTITPFAGFPYPGWYSPEKEAIRQTVNKWIRHSSGADGVVDFAAAVRGHYKPALLAAKQKPLPPGMANICAGDPGLHPNDRGYAVMGARAYDVLFSADVKPKKTCH